MAEATRAGGWLGATVPAAADKVEPFWLYWSAARDILGAAEPASYPHHRFADPDPLTAMTASCGWREVEVRPVSSDRALGADELWAWLHQTLPVLDRGGAWIGRDRIDAAGDSLRRRVFELASTFRRGSRYVVRSAGWLLTARVASPPAQ